MTNSLQRINEAVTEIHNQGLKVNQVRVMKLTGLSRSTVHNYWERKINPNDIDWLESIRQKVKEIHLMRNKTAMFIRKLIAENNELKEEIRLLKESKPTSVDNIFNDLIKWSYGDKPKTNGTYNKIK